MSESLICSRISLHFHPSTPILNTQKNKAPEQEIVIVKSFRLFPVAIAFFMITIQCANLKDARKAYDEQNHTRVIQLCRQAIASDSADVDAYLLLSRSYRRVDSLDMALNTVQTAYRLDARSPEILDVYIGTLVDLGQRAASEDKHRDAMTYFESAESLSPQNPDVLRPMADLYFLQGELGKAEEMYEKLTTIVSDSTVTQRLAEIETRSQDATALFEKGLKAYKNGRFKTSKSFCSKALKIKVDHIDARYILLMADGRLHVKRATKKSYWDAIDAFGKAAGLRSDAAEPHFRMAQAYEKKDPDEFVNAIDAYEMALKLEPDGSIADICKKKIKELKTRKEKLDKFWGRKK